MAYIPFTPQTLTQGQATNPASATLLARFTAPQDGVYSIKLILSADGSGDVAAAQPGSQTVLFDYSGSQQFDFGDVALLATETFDVTIANSGATGRFWATLQVK